MRTIPIFAPRFLRRRWWAERYGNVHRSWSRSFVIAAANRKVDQ